MACSSKEINIKSIEGNIMATMSRLHVFDPENKPLVEVSPENGELSIKVQSFLDKDFESRLKSGTKKRADTDVLVFICMGNASTGLVKHDIDLNCNIVTEYGLPYSLKNNRINGDLGKVIQKARDEIITVFENARHQSIGCAMQ